MTFPTLNNFALVNCGSYFAAGVVIFMVANPLIEWARWRIGLSSAW